MLSRKEQLQNELERMEQLLASEKITLQNVEDMIESIHSKIDNIKEELDSVTAEENHQDWLNYVNKTRRRNFNIAK